jgi:hypothetical protein
VVSGQKTYARPDLGFCLSFPSRFVQKEVNPGQTLILGPALDQSTPPMTAGLEVRVVPATDTNINKEVDAYLAKVAGDKSKIRRAPYTLGNETALLVDGIPGSKYGSRDLFAVHNGMFFHVIITPSDISNPVAQTDVEELLQTTIASFTYTK